MPAAESPEAAGSANADIKTSFIAAARRAAQAAQAEASAQPATGEAKGAAAVPGPAGAGRVARLRAEIDRRRRPLLLHRTGLLHLRNCRMRQDGRRGKAGGKHQDGG